MNIFKRLYLSFKYGANSPITQPENAWAYQQNTIPPKPIKNVTPKPLAPDSLVRRS